MIATLRVRASEHHFGMYDFKSPETASFAPAMRPADEPGGLIGRLFPRRPTGNQILSNCTAPPAAKQWARPRQNRPLHIWLSVLLCYRTASHNLNGLLSFTTHVSAQFGSEGDVGQPCHAASKVHISRRVRFGFGPGIRRDWPPMVVRSEAGESRLYFSIGIRVALI